MNPKIIIATVAAFAAACNQHLSKSEQSMEIKDLALTPDGKLSALLVPRKGYSHPSAPGSLHEVSLVQGTIAEAESRLAEVVAANPYISPVKLLVTGAAAGAGAEEKPKGKSKSRVILVLGAFQP